MAETQARVVRLTPYKIIRAAQQAPIMLSRPKTLERQTMEELEVGDAFLVIDFNAAQRCTWARAEMKPRRFSVRKVPGQGWQVRRVE